MLPPSPLSSSPSPSPLPLLSPSHSSSSSSSAAADVKAFNRKFRTFCTQRIELNQKSLLGLLLVGFIFCCAIFVMLYTLPANNALDADQTINTTPIDQLTLTPSSNPSSPLSAALITSQTASPKSSLAGFLKMNPTLSWSLHEPAAVEATRRFRSPYIGNVSMSSLIVMKPTPPTRYVAKESVNILFSWSPRYCSYAFVTWRSIRRLDLTRQRDIHFMVERDAHWGKMIQDEEDEAKRHVNSTLEERLTRLQKTFDSSAMNRSPECRSLVNVIVHESRLQHSALLRLHGGLDSGDYDLASTIGVGSTHLAFFAPVIPPPDIRIKFKQWHYSLNKLHLFAHTRYHRALLLDCDVVLVRDLDSYFDRGEDLVAVRDQWHHCSRPDKLNGGVLAFRPSVSLFHTAMWMLNHRPTKCMGNRVFYESDQSVINCMCGVGGRGYMPHNQPHDIACGFFPSRMGLFSGNGDDVNTTAIHCPQTVDDEVAAVHFTWKPKPLDWSEAKCIPASSLSSPPSTTISTPDLPPVCYSGLSSMFTFWHCLYDRHNFEPTELRRQCRYAQAPLTLNEITNTMESTSG